MRAECVRKSIDASCVAFELIDDIQVLNPFPVAVEPRHARIARSIRGNLPFQQAIKNCVLHDSGRVADLGSWGGGEGKEAEGVGGEDSERWRGSKGSRAEVNLAGEVVEKDGE